MEENIICHCNEITEGEIIKAIKEKGLTTVEEIQEETTAGTVCEGCVPDLEEILARVTG